MAAPESVTRVGIIGCGNISSAYIDGCRMFDFLRVSAVADIAAEAAQSKACLLYTSDAADERSSVDLGGRRIIKKKKTMKMNESAMT